MHRSRRKTRLLAPEPPEIGRPFRQAPPAAVEAGPEPAAEAPTDAHDDVLAEAYREGVERAQQELAAEVETFRAEARESLQRIAEFETTFRSRYESEMLDLVLAAVSRIVRDRIERGDPVAERALAEALEALPASTTVRARVHADDLTSIRDANRAAVEAGRIELVADASLGRGGVILETDSGSVDATLETAERAVREAIHDGEGTA